MPTNEEIKEEVETLYCKECDAYVKKEDLIVKEDRIIKRFIAHEPKTEDSGSRSHKIDLTHELNNCKDVKFIGRHKISITTAANDPQLEVESSESDQMEMDEYSTTHDYMVEVTLKSGITGSFQIEDIQTFDNEMLTVVIAINDIYIEGDHEGHKIPLSFKSESEYVDLIPDETEKIAHAIVNALSDEGFSDIYKESNFIDKLKDEIESLLDEPPIIVAARKGDIGEIVTLVGKGADVNFLTPLVFDVDGCVYENKDVALKILELGADTGWKDAGGRTLLEITIENDKYCEDTLITELILSRGVIPARKITKALKMAIELGRSLEIIDALVRHGANVNARNSSGQSLLNIALGDDPEDFDDGYSAAVIDILIKNGADVNVSYPLYSAVSLGKVQSATLLLNAGAVFIMDNKKPIIFGVLWAGDNAAEILRLLINRGADINAESGGSTVLIDAVFEGETELVKNLLEAGANRDVKATQKNIAGKTALDIAIEDENEEMINLLQGRDKCRA